MGNIAHMTDHGHIMADLQGGIQKGSIPIFDGLQKISGMQVQAVALRPTQRHRFYLGAKVPIPMWPVMFGDYFPSPAIQDQGAIVPDKGNAMVPTVIAPVNAGGLFPE